MPARFLLVAPATLNLGRDLEAGCTKSSIQFEGTEALGRFWGGFGRLWGGLGSFGSLKINLGATFGRLWETLGDSGGGFGETLGGFGVLWEMLGKSLGSLWGALGKLWEPFTAFLLLAPSLPPLYIKKIQLPINRFSGSIVV